MIEITGKEIEVTEDTITIADNEPIEIRPGEVYVTVTGDGKNGQRRWINRINEKPCDMGTMEHVTIALLAVGKESAFLAPTKDGE